MYTADGYEAAGDVDLARSRHDRADPTWRASLVLGVGGDPEPRPARSVQRLDTEPTANIERAAEQIERIHATAAVRASRRMPGRIRHPVATQMLDFARPAATNKPAAMAIRDHRRDTEVTAVETWRREIAVRCTRPSRDDHKRPELQVGA